MGGPAYELQRRAGIRLVKIHRHGPGAGGVLPGDAREGIPEGNPLRIPRIEIEDALHPGLRDQAQQPFHQIPVRIQHRNPMALPDIVQDHVFQEGGFAHPVASQEMGLRLRDQGLFDG